MVKSIECAVRGPEFRFQAYQLLVVAFLVSQMVKILPAVQESWILSMGWEDPWRRKWHLIQFSCLENPMDRGAWQPTGHGVSKESETT